MATTKLKQQGFDKTLPAGDLVGTTDAQTLSSKTLTSVVSISSASGSVATTSGNYATLYDFPTGRGCYLVNAWYDSGETGAKYSYFNIVVTETNGACRFILNNNSDTGGGYLSCILADAGSNARISVVQTSGSALTVYYNIVKLS